MLTGIVAVQTHQFQLLDALFYLWHFLGEFVDVEHHHHVLIVACRLMHGIGEWCIHQHIVVGLSHLHKALYALYIFHHGRCILPDGVGGTHVYRGIELPPWPCRFTWRIGGTMEQDVIDTGGKEQVQFGFDL